MRTLPWPHREAFAPLAQACVTFTPALFRRVALSLVFGAATLVICDACTHIRGGQVEQVAWLQAPVWSYRWFVMPNYQALQHGSTLLGTALLIWAYRRWLRDLNIPDCINAIDEQWRYRALWCITALAFAGAFWLALPSIVGIRPDHVLGVFAREMAVQGVVLLAKLYTACALATCGRRS